MASARRRWWPDGIAARLALTIVVALVATQSLTLLLFTAAREPPQPIYSTHWLTERVALRITEAVAVPPERRAARLETIDEEWLSFEWRPDFRPAEFRRTTAWPYRNLTARLNAELGGKVAQIVVGTVAPPTRTFVRREPPQMVPPDYTPERPNRSAQPRTLDPARLQEIDAPVPGGFRIAVRTLDGGWIVVAPNYPGVETGRLLWFALWILLVGAIIAALSLWSAGRLIVPLRQLAGAATRFGTSLTSKSLPEQGPREVREITHALNQMQERLKRFVDDRTQMVAAISHDLRTPLTRLRLRAEFVGDAEQQKKMLADIADMEAIVAGTLSFARQEASNEPYVRGDLAALLSSLCDDMADAGQNAAYDGPDRLALHYQPTAIKRAFNNLLDNAVKYGARAEVRLIDGPDDVTVTIADDGPGIEPGEREAVFRPFYRLERSRSRETGGSGLGLAVARTVIRGHGGDITLGDRQPRGLLVTVRLPKTAGDGAKPK
ncbi:MAG: ATP-binding protein [Alphaproteobacteria bacterium]